MIPTTSSIAPTMTVVYSNSIPSQVMLVVPPKLYKVVLPSGWESKQERLTTFQDIYLSPIVNIAFFYIRMLHSKLENNYMCHAYLHDGLYLTIKKGACSEEHSTFLSRFSTDSCYPALLKVYFTQIE